MRILIATDAWRPQVNGVVRSLESMAGAASALGATIEFLTPQDFASFPMPTYPEIQLALAWPGAVSRRLAQGYEHVHIATEGPVGLATRACCRRQGRRFTTSYHTRFPEYIHARSRLPVSVTYALLRRFHNSGCGTMVSTQTLAQELAGRGFRRLMRWSRGVDHGLFQPGAAIDLGLPRPIFLYAGRLAVEKNVEAFLSLDLPGTKLVVGDGPARSALEARFPQARFVGVKTSAELATLYASSDVFVFPSRTDTFGMVLLEAMACGLPVAAFPVAGPLDVVGGSGAGVLSEDLQAACLAATEVPRAVPRDHALTFTWEASARQFLDNVAAAHQAGESAASGKAASAEQPKLFVQGEMIKP
ncbi:glycosyltransferase family 1 protein [Methylosinus sp. Sm6]|uniref:glycosyltransferase family 4 protein n=1 Tax=Methylosinus sp. Sm6 TaxID=2866948 RepID=UPI001C994783|nr:glycosyltransferase family 1 protein [Methylosinus sp. Sm6]MBY6240711.1 glycosyltransferase family 1 protein [Methylosinus sp. Sm6]